MVNLFKQIYICKIGIIADMKLNTRLRIIDHLRKHQTASALELSNALGTTGANIRHHLAMLESNDLIEMIAQRKEGGRGRPVMVYGLSRHVLGDGLDELSAALMAEWLGGLSDGERETGLRSLARRLAGADSDIHAPMAKRLNLAVERLNQMHYQARWEASAAGPRLVLGHCPFSAVIARCPELCRMDVHLLNQVLHANVQQVTKLEIGVRGEKFCSFQVSG